ncbi:MAG: hypothetical protein MUD11_15390 [Rhodobacteraceae bacterium]|jgi:hypothetical protein|nr:hypothetical protein [Paracoccaceae bacterium]
MLLRALLLLAATIAFGAAPLVTPPFTGYDPGIFPVEIARPSIQPAGYAFSIWALIYIGLIVHALFGVLRRMKDAAWNVVRLPMAASIAIGTIWLWIAPDYPITATAAIWAMLGLAGLAFLRVSAQDRLLLATPIAIYTGWLTAAANVSLGVVVAGYGWLTDTEAAAAMLALALTIGVSVQLRRPADFAYGLTLIWALIGIVVVNWQPNFTVSALAAGGILVMAITIFGARKRLNSAA